MLIPLLALQVLSFLFMPVPGRTVVHFVSWAGLLLLALSSTIFFLLGTGLYFSSRLKATNSAVVATLAVYYLPKVFCCGCLSPLFIASTGMVTVMTGQSGHSTPAAMLLLAIAPTMIYGGFSLLFLRLATARVRRDVF